jgi:hypothetical protein
MNDGALTGDDYLWNWARWTWSGATVGNMETFIPEEDDHRPIHYDHARRVEILHSVLPWHERMVIIAEYPQKNAMFGGMGNADRSRAARRWIDRVTGVALTDTEYRLYLGFFKNTVERDMA